ncbi:MAG TPA: hypothetical protein PK129_11690 [Cellvibrionaceae bacterium]|nr:hypothetical protein [Cellvibrionaceae bacterium]
MKTIKSIFSADNIENVTLNWAENGSGWLEVNLIDKRKDIKIKVELGSLDAVCWSKFKSATEGYLPLREYGGL